MDVLDVGGLGAVDVGRRVVQRSASIVEDWGGECGGDKGQEAKASEDHVE